ncbi:MAG: SDR family oxidoreductase [Nitrospinota bacterium]|nr:MAG: SDR family oxidoreductase [Nitrospinota bacterium]
MQRILIAGATSMIAQETARLFAADGDRFFLVGRHAEKLEAVAEDLRVRGAAQVDTFCLDLTRLDRHEELWQQALSTLGQVDILLIAHGTLPDQQRCQQSVPETLQALNTNFLSVVSLLTLAANYFEARRAGCIAVISSVAGERGRQSNYVYGTAKGAVSLFLQGLRNRLFPAGVAVLTIKPGFVDTPMTAAMEKNRLFASPATVAQGIYRAIRQRKDVVYLPWFWRWIMLIIRLIPERVFKRLRL